LLHGLAAGLEKARGEQEAPVREVGRRRFAEISGSRRKPGRSRIAKRALCRSICICLILDWWRLVQAQGDGPPFLLMVVPTRVQPHSNTIRMSRDACAEMAAPRTSQTYSSQSWPIPDTLWVEVWVGRAGSLLPAFLLRVLMV
jgi:hypothetical protein